MEPRGLFNELPVNRVLHFPLYGNGDGFRHFIAGNHPNSFFP
jgi:hypothetical protein